MQSIWLANEIYAVYLIGQEGVQAEAWLHGVKVAYYKDDSLSKQPQRETASGSGLACWDRANLPRGD